MKGLQRHILVDTEGFLVAVVVDPADIQYQGGAFLMLAQAAAQTQRVPHAWADAAC